MVMETLPSGTILHGRYRIERVLGSGGFGHVYVAVDLQTNQQYAIKEYLLTGPSGQAQLQHEARVLTQLHHPNLPAFQEAFDEHGRYYVVLGYIEGSDLTDYIRIVRQRNEVIPIARVMTWILSICDAVAFLHNQQPPVIHRDIKPDNIRITSDGTAVLVDLGNAKAAADGARTLFFIRHQGTPGYAPLEQYPGGSGTDVRSDVYALGGTLYFALTAQEPPSVSTRNQSIQQGVADLPSLKELLAKNPAEDSTETYASRQFRLGVSRPGKPAPRHSRHLAQLGTLPPELLDQLNRIIKRAMGMKQKERYHTVVEFSNDLKKVLAALPSPTPPVGTSRPVDPHSTQPDLPHLFETMQDAKEKRRMEPQNISVAPTQQPAAPTAPTLRCPRCNSELLPKAVFCPHCGTSLANLFKTNVTAQPATPNAIPNNKSAPQNKASFQRTSPDQTRIGSLGYTYSARNAPSIGPTLATQTPRQNTISAIPPAQPAQQAQAQSFVQNAVTATPSPGKEIETSVNKTSSPLKADSSQKVPKMLVALAAILIVVILIIGFLLYTTIRHHNSYHFSPGNGQYYTHSVLLSE